MGALEQTTNPQPPTHHSVPVITQWIMDQVPLGHKRPRLGMARLIHCPACRGLVEFPIALTSGHVFHECMAVEELERASEITRQGVRTLEGARRQPLNPDGEVIDIKEHLLRGASLDILVKMWLFMWGQEETD